MCRWAAGSKAMRKREIEMFQRHTEKVFGHKVQAYYSLRCVPQILGPIWDTMAYAGKVLVEIILPERCIVQMDQGAEHGIGHIAHRAAQTPADDPHGPVHAGVCGNALQKQDLIGGQSQNAAHGGRRTAGRGQKGIQQKI